MTGRGKDGWRVEDGAFIDGGNTVKASCHHRTQGACGGCYARLQAFLDAVDASPADAEELARQVSDELRREGAQ
jgi:hypothetical protein